MRLVGYVRVSRVAGREGPSFISPGLQRERIETWAQGNGHTLVAVLEDLDSPGSRVGPGLTRAMGLVNERAADGIVVAKLDRFGRSVVHLGQLVEQLRDAGGALFSVAEGVDTRGTTGKLVADILTAIAEWELARIRENWAAARENAEARGVYLAEAPMGFRKLEDRSLEPDANAPIIAEAFNRRVSGDSWAVIARWLTTQIPSRRGGAWTVAAVRRMVANRVYVERGLVSAPTFERANVVRGVAPSRSGRASGLLSGILRCAGCRYAMKLSQGKSRHGKPFTEYRCKAARGESAGGRCPAPASVKSSVVEPFVLDAFWEAVGDYSAKGVASDSALVDAERTLVEAEAELNAALDTRLAEVLERDDSYLTMVASRKARVDEAQSALGQTRQRSVALPSVEHVRELWPDLSLYEQRKLLAAALDCVFIRRGESRDAIGTRAFVCLAGEAPELPVRGVRWHVKPFEFPRTSEAGR